MIYDKLKKIDDLKQHKRKVDQLREAGDFIIKSIIQASYTKHINFKMPEGAPPFERNEKDVEFDAKYFNQRIQGIMNFKKHQWAREKEFTDLCSYINEKDADIMIAMKDKKLTDIFPTFTRELCKEVYPEMKL